MKKWLAAIVVASAFAVLIGWTPAEQPVASEQANVTQTVTLDADHAISLPETDLDAERMGGERCYQCDDSGSSGKCSGSNRCRGTKSSCKSRGCKFTGGSSSSCTGSNYKYCKD